MDETQERLLAAAIGAELRSWRQRKRLTQEELSKLVGKGKNTIQRYESGETMPNIPDTFRIAEALDVPVAKIIERAEDAYMVQSEYALAANEGDVEPHDDEHSDDA